MESEILTDEELAAITGYKTPSKQREWLIAERWIFHTTRAARPVVGRVYARMRLAGIAPKNAPAETWSLDLSKVG